MQFRYAQQIRKYNLAISKSTKEIRQQHMVIVG